MKRKFQKAFTLVEVLIAMLVLAVGLLGLAAMTVVVLKSNILSQQISESTTIATDLINRMKRVDWATISAGACPTPMVATACAGAQEAGLPTMPAEQRPANANCAIAGIYADTVSTYEVIQGNLTRPAAGVFAQPTAAENFCAIAARNPPEGTYIRYYRVTASGAAMSLVAGVFFRDRNGKWRVVELDTLRRSQ